MIQARDFVLAKLYESEEDVIADSLHCLLLVRPNMRVELAIYQYQSSDISIGKAANLAGVSFEQMKSILLSRGIVLRLGPETPAEALEEVMTLRGHLRDRASDQ